MKKILVCGASGFLMSNFMRYMMYRTRDYVFSSIDLLEDPKDYECVYQNRRHGFHIGDARDQAFMKKVAHVEKPDFIVCGPSFPSLQDAVAVVCSAQEVFPPESIIHVIPSSSAEPKRSSAWNCTANAVDPESIILSIQACFGMRDRHTGFAQAMKRLLEDSEHGVERKEPAWVHVKPWCYAEDVASMIWYVLENPPPPDERNVCMPWLGRGSLADLMDIAAQELGMLDGQAPVLAGPGKFPEHLEWCDWEPDTDTLGSAVRKTARWYNKNRWILPMVKSRE